MEIMLVVVVASGRVKPASAVVAVATPPLAFLATVLSALALEVTTGRISIRTIVGRLMCVLYMECTKGRGVGGWICGGGRRVAGDGR